MCSEAWSSSSAARFAMMVAMGEAEMRPAVGPQCVLLGLTLAFQELWHMPHAMASLRKNNPVAALSDMMDAR